MASLRISLLAASSLAAIALHAQVTADLETESSAPATTVEGIFAVSAGRAWVDGDEAAFQKRFQHRSDGFGGLEELRYRRDTENSSLQLDGRALLGDADYALIGRWTRGELWHVDFGLKSFRTFYDASGGYFRPTATFFAPLAEELHVDRRSTWIEFAFTPEDSPHVRLRYERQTRDGRKPSTTWGDTNLTGGRGARSVVPAFLELDETRDIVTGDVSRRTPDYRWAAGARYDRTKLDNARQHLRRPGEPAARRAVTTQENTSSDLFSTHAFAEKRVTEALTLSAGALVTTLDTNLSGSRLYGPDYDPVFDPLLAQRQVGDVGFHSLEGGTQMKQHVFNLNALYRPTKHWSILPALRYENVRYDNVATLIATNVLNNLSTSLQSLAAQSQRDEDRLTATTEIRYTGRPHWAYTFRAEWFRAEGELAELMTDRVTTLTALNRATDYTRASQKYALSANWYARAGLTISGEYYYKLRLNDYAHLRDSTPPGTADRYPAFITNQDFSLHDFNTRVSWRPSSQLSLVTRYDLQSSTVASSHLGLNKIRSARITRHIASQSVTWSPLPRLYVTGSGNVVYDQLATPAANFVLNSDNNYVNGSLGAGYALTKRSDLYLDLSHYQAKDFSDNSAVSLPYGADEKTDTASLTYTLRPRERVMYTFKYTYADHQNRTAGGQNDYRAHLLYSKVQYKF